MKIEKVLLLLTTLNGWTPTDPLTVAKGDQKSLSEKSPLSNEINVLLHTCDLWSFGCFDKSNAYISSTLGVAMLSGPSAASGTAGLSGVPGGNAVAGVGKTAQFHTMKKSRSPLTQTPRPRAFSLSWRCSLKFSSECCQTECFLHRRLIAFDA